MVEHWSPKPIIRVQVPFFLFIFFIKPFISPKQRNKKKKIIKI